MDVYVVRIYRNPNPNGREMFGCVEIVDENDDDNNIRQFSTTDELMDIITQGSQLGVETSPEQAMPGTSDEASDVVDKDIEGLRHHCHKVSERHT